MKNLLAKSYNQDEYPKEPPHYALLTQHSRDVAEACRSLAKGIGLQCLENANIEAFSQKDLEIALVSNGWLQDLGKANSHFQTMLSKPGFSQLLRHEVISCLLSWNEPLRSWLTEEIKSHIFLAAIWGAVGHHRKFECGVKPREVEALTVLTTHPDFVEILSDMQKDLSLSPPPSFSGELTVRVKAKEESDIGGGAALRDLQDDFDEEAKSVGTEFKKFIAIVKALGIAADVCASSVAKGHQRGQYSISEYIERSLLTTGLSEQDISDLILVRVWSQVAVVPKTKNEFPEGFTFRTFQSDIGESSAIITLACAGCGSGKSLASYLWAKRWCIHAANQGRTNFRLYFCLPTTGTTTEHYRDYALESGVDASLTHSRSSIDLKTISETTSQEEASETDTAAQAAKASIRSAAEKIESLALWSTPLVVTTTDTVLGLMANARKSICSMPAIMNSAIVFDEIHAFDDNLFGHLLVFVKNFPNVPVLLMTASLPEDRKRALLSVRKDLKIINGPADFERLPRYQIEFPSTTDQSWRLLRESVEKEEKILWIRNRVDWANETFDRCKSEFSHCADTLVYHSRFKYKHRSRRHVASIGKFKTKGKSTILVTTQVAEMSLDLSADLLITDLCAVPALIQRMGRLNRTSSPGNVLPARKCLINDLSEEQSLPYSTSEIADARNWLNNLAGIGTDLSQYHLASEFAKICPMNDFDMEAAERRAVFFSGIWETRPGKTRAEGYTVSVLLAEDVQLLQASGREPTRDWIRLHEVAIPYKDSVSTWKKLAYLPVAPATFVHYQYDEDTDEGKGASWLQ